jgi:hypothetical protein
LEDFKENPPICIGGFEGNLSDSPKMILENFLSVKTKLNQTNLEK